MAILYYLSKMVISMAMLNYKRVRDASLPVIVDPGALWFPWWIFG